MHTKKMLGLPLAFACGLAGLALLAPVRQNPKLLPAFLGAAAALGARSRIDS